MYRARSQSATSPKAIQERINTKSKELEELQAESANLILELE